MIASLHAAPQLNFIQRQFLLHLHLCSLFFLIGDPAFGAEPADHHQELKRLSTLPYASWTPVRKEDVEKVGVTYHDPSLAYAGYNLLVSKSHREALLLDMAGQPVHRWTSEEVLPPKSKFEAAMGFTAGGWWHAAIDRKGQLIAVEWPDLVVKLTAQSALQWRVPERAHHELFLDADGTIYTVNFKLRTVPFQGASIPVIDNEVVVLRADGKRLATVSLYDSLIDTEELQRAMQAQLALQQDEVKQTALKEKLAKKRARIEAFFKQQQFDELLLNFLLGIDDGAYANVLWVNAFSRLKQDRPGLWQRGDWLICALKLDSVVVLDQHTHRVKWRFGAGQLQKPHHPTALRNGNILIFDNGKDAKRSRLVEVDPTTNRIVWSYGEKPEERFFSATQGGAQELPNGNLLITESERGRAFEITRSGKKVWEYFSAATKDATKEKFRGAFYRMVRYAPTEVPFLMAAKRP